MSRRLPASLFLAASLLFSPLAPFLAAQHGRARMVWNYDGGLPVTTDGEIASGPCFRLNGRVTAPDYFDNLKRIDTDHDSVVRRGPEVVTEFPSELHLTFLMSDIPCDIQLHATSTRTYLTKTLVSSLRLSLYWKHGLELRPADGIAHWHIVAYPVQPYVRELAADSPERYEWEFAFDLSSVGVPVTDSLVVVLRTPDGHIAARAAARM